VNGHEEFIQDQDTGIQGGSGTGVHEAPFLAVPRQADPSFARRVSRSYQGAREESDSSSS
jgi:hypothetical protein